MNQIPPILPFIRQRTDPPSCVAEKGGDDNHINISYIHRITLKSSIILTVLLFISLSASAQILYTAPALSTSTLPEGVAVDTVAPPAQELNLQPEPKKKYIPPSQSLDSIQNSPISLSGTVLMPTAYRGRGKNTLGLGIDINAAYYIGRLYGKNTLDWTMQKTNYVDRVGVWLLVADAKMLVQTEAKYRPALAAGVQGIYALRDAPSPTLNPASSPSLTVSVNKTNALGGIYLVASKRPFSKVLLSAGVMEG